MMVLLIFLIGILLLMADLEWGLYYILMVHVVWSVVNTCIVWKYDHDLFMTLVCLLTSLIFTPVLVYYLFARDFR